METIDGKLYVKASDVTKALGSEEIYDAETGTFPLTQQNQVTEVVKAASPAIVATSG